MAEPAKEKTSEEKEAERQEVERIMTYVRGRIPEMHGIPPEEAEKAHQWFKGQCADERLPAAFKREVLDKVRSLECEINMRATDEALQAAIDLAHAEKMHERAEKLGQARAYYTKASALGADEKFLKATLRRIETAMMTGGVYKPGMATKAKPADTPPKKPG